LLDFIELKKGGATMGKMKEFQIFLHEHSDYVNVLQGSFINAFSAFIYSEYMGACRSKADKKFTIHCPEMHYLKEVLYEFSEHYKLIASGVIEEILCQLENNFYNFNISEVFDYQDESNIVIMDVLHRANKKNAIDPSLISIASKFKFDANDKKEGIYVEDPDCNHIDLMEAFPSYIPYIADRIMISLIYSKYQDKFHQESNRTFNQFIYDKKWLFVIINHHDFIIPITISKYMLKNMYKCPALYSNHGISKKSDIENNTDSIMIPPYAFATGFCYK